MKTKQTITITIPLETFERVKAEAKKDMRSVSSYIGYILEKQFKQMPKLIQRGGIR